MMSLGLYEDFNASWNFQPSVFTGLNAFAENLAKTESEFQLVLGVFEILKCL